MAVDMQRLIFVNDNASSIGKPTAERKQLVRSHVMIGVHGRPRRTAMEKFDSVSKGKQIVNLSESHQRKSIVASFEAKTPFVVVSRQGSTKGDLKVRQSLPNVTNQPKSLVDMTGFKAIEASLSSWPSSVSQDREAGYDGNTQSICEGGLSSLNTPQNLSVEGNLVENAADQEHYQLSSKVSLTWLDQSLSDPFSASACIDRSELRHLHHFFHSVLPSRRRRLQVHQWKAYHAVLAIPAVRYSVLAKAIMHLGMVMTISDNSTLQDLTAFREYTSNSLIYKGRTTRLISQSLSTDDATSDPIFFAVMDMVCCYTSMGEIGEVTPHIRGLNTLIQLRRGIQQLSAFLGYRVIRSDNVVAAMTGDLPIIDVRNFVSSPLDKQLAIAFDSIPPLKIHLLYSLLAQAFDLEDFVSQLSPSVLLFERSLLVQSFFYYKILRNPNGAEGPFLQLHIKQSVRLATIIYIEISLVNTWRFSTILANLVRRLKGSLESTDLTTSWLPYSDILLLVLLLGGIGGAGRLERAWFVGRLQDIALSLDLDSFDAVEAVLGESLVKNIVGQLVELMRRLWRDVQRGLPKGMIK